MELRLSDVKGTKTKRTEINLCEPWPQQTHMMDGFPDELFVKFCMFRCLLAENILCTASHNASKHLEEAHLYNYVNNTDTHTHTPSVSVGDNCQISNLL